MPCIYIYINAGLQHSSWGQLWADGGCQRASCGPLSPLHAKPASQLPPRPHRHTTHSNHAQAGWDAADAAERCGGGAQWGTHWRPRHQAHPSCGYTRAHAVRPSATRPCDTPGGSTPTRRCPRRTSAPEAHRAHTGPTQADTVPHPHLQRCTSPMTRVTERGGVCSGQGAAAARQLHQTDSCTSHPPV